MALYLTIPRPSGLCWKVVRYLTLLRISLRPGFDFKATCPRRNSLALVTSALVRESRTSDRIPACKSGSGQKSIRSVDKGDTLPHASLKIGPETYRLCSLSQHPCLILELISRRTALPLTTHMARLFDVFIVLSSLLRFYGVQPFDQGHLGAMRHRLW
jgi:hypothetical protein